MATTEPHPAKTDTKWTPPYTSYTTFTNLLDRMANEGGAPSRLDRSYLSNMQGGARSTFVKGLKSLDLLTKDAVPTDMLKLLVASTEEHRKELVGDLVRRYYAPVLDLDPMATQAQLESTFREWGVNGSTLRKSIGFFLAAARAADIKVSPHFKLPKLAPGEARVRSKGSKDENGTVAGGPTTTLLDPPKTVDRTGPKLHPFIEGLVGSLPKPGDTFSADMQEAWFDTARGIFRLIYKPGRDSTQARAPKTPAAATGEASDD